MLKKKVTQGVKKEEKKYEFKIGCEKKLAKITVQDQKINNRSHYLC